MKSLVKKILVSNCGRVPLLESVTPISFFMSLVIHVYSCLLSSYASHERAAPNGTSVMVLS